MPLLLPLRRELTVSQRQAFFAVRLWLGLVSSLCEAFFFRAVVETVNERVGRYLFFCMLFSVGMWNAATGQTYPLAEGRNRR